MYKNCDDGYPPPPPPSALSAVPWRDGSGGGGGSCGAGGKGAEQRPLPGPPIAQASQAQAAEIKAATAAEVHEAEPAAAAVVANTSSSFAGTSSFAVVPAISGFVGAVVLQHEEWTWKGWRPSTEKDFPNFMGPGGVEVPLDIAVAQIRAKEIRVGFNENTDKEGWKYGLMLRKIEEPRPGGRSVSMPLDRVRRRRWVAAATPTEDEAALVNLALAASVPASRRTSASSAAGRGNWPRLPQLDTSDKEAISKLLQLLMTYLGKRHPSDILSVMTDPTVGFRLMWQHEEVYRNALEAACEPVDFDSMSAQDKRLLSDTARAAEFACAVYGAPMLEGHLNSAVAFMGGAAAHNIGAWNHDENTKAFQKFSRVLQEDVFFASWVERTYEPAFVIAWERERRWLVLAIRGTVDWRACLTDATAHTAEVCGGMTHEGMLRAARAVLERALPVIREALREQSDYDLVCTGHSMGAGTAMLVTLLLRKGEMATEDDPPALRRTTAYGIGTPPLLTPELAEESLQWAVSIERGMDFISRLSVFGVDRLLFELTQASAAKMATDWFMKSIGQANNHHKRFERTFGLDREVAVVLMPPGRILHIDTTIKRENAAEGRPRPAYWASSSFYQRYLLSMTMLNDHLPREYFTDISLIAAAAEDAATKSPLRAPMPPHSGGHAFHKDSDSSRNDSDDEGTTASAPSSDSTTAAAASDAASMLAARAAVQEEEEEGERMPDP